MREFIKTYYKDYIFYNRNLNKQVLIINDERKLKSDLWFEQLDQKEILLPEGYKDALQYLEFKKTPKLPDKPDYYIPVFIKPVVYKKRPEYRLIALNPRYAVNTDGLVIDITTDKIIKPDMRRVYPSIKLKNNNRRKEYRLHRLVAITWVDNNNFELKPIVDHIDGIKKNFRAENLRWTDNKGNLKFSVYQGLNRTNIPVKIRNIDTKEVKEFPSFTEACKYIGRSRFQETVSDLRPGKIWSGDNGKFEIKYQSDNTEWYFDRFKVQSPKLVRYIFNVYIPLENGKYNIKPFNSPREAYIYLLKQDSIGMLDVNVIATLKAVFPNYKFEFAKNEGYEAYNGKEEFKAPTAQALSEKIHVPKSTIIKYAKLGVRHKEWMFRRSNPLNGKWEYKEEYVPENRNVPVKVIFIDSGETKIFNSARETAKELNISRHYVKHNYTYKNYKFIIEK